MMSDRSRPETREKEDLSDILPSLPHEFVAVDLAPEDRPEERRPTLTGV
jgi:hypothetical protein